MRLAAPLTPAQAEAESQGFKPLPPGEYDFRVHDASDEISKKTGAEMLKLTLHVYTPDGKHRVVFDYLLESMAYKIRHFAEAVGMVDQYERGVMDTVEIAEREGRLKLRIKPASGDYPAGNQVFDYIPRAEGERAAKPQRTPAIDRAPTPSREKVMAGDIDDEIPF